MNIPDAYSHPLFNPDIDRATHYHTRNILCTAIKDMSGRSIAVVQVRQRAPQHTSMWGTGRVEGVSAGTTLRHTARCMCGILPSALWEGPTAAAVTECGSNCERLPPIHVHCFMQGGAAPSTQPLSQPLH